MALNSEIRAFGPFHSRIADCLDHPAQCYVGMSEGVRVVTHLFYCEETGQSRRLAHAMGITNPWDFAQHPISPTSSSITEIWERFSDLDRESFSADFEKFVRLVDAGFGFIFVLNG